MLTRVDGTLGLIGWEMVPWTSVEISAEGWWGQTGLAGGHSTSWTIFEEQFGHQDGSLDWEGAKGGKEGWWEIWKGCLGREEVGEVKGRGGNCCDDCPTFAQMG